MSNKCSHWDRIILSLVSNKLNEEITWKSWITVESKTKADKESKNKRIKHSTGTIEECAKQLIEIDLMRKKKKSKTQKEDPELGFTFVKHYFTQSYQHRQYSECIKQLVANEAVFTQDFSNPIDCTPQDEVKAGRYGGPPQVTCHPTVMHLGPSGEEKIVIIHLSDNKKHNAHMVHYITVDCIKYILRKYPDVKKIYLWSDGCPTQYKCKTSFYYLKKIFNVEVERNFFGSEHGKNESDGVTGEISRKIHDAIKSRNIDFSNAREVQVFLSKAFPKYISKIITDEDLKPIYDEFQNVDLKVLSGTCTRTLHQIKPGKGKDEYLVRPYSCFCKMCKIGKFVHCDNKDFTNGHFVSETWSQIDQTVIRTRKIKVIIKLIMQMSSQRMIPKEATMKKRRRIQRKRKMSMIWRMRKRRKSQ